MSTFAKAIAHAVSGEFPTLNQDLKMDLTIAKAGLGPGYKTVSDMLEHLDSSSYVTCSGELSERMWERDSFESVFCVSLKYQAGSFIPRTAPKLTLSISETSYASEMYECVSEGSLAHEVKIVKGGTLSQMLQREIERRVEAGEPLLPADFKLFEKSFLLEVKSPKDWGLARQTIQEVMTGASFSLRETARHPMIKIDEVTGGESIIPNTIDRAKTEYSTDSDGNASLALGELFEFGDHFVTKHFASKSQHAHALMGGAGAAAVTPGPVVMP